MNQTEIFILSGFLGSGKTTLLKRMLEDEHRLERKTAVMMNELGKVSIDSAVVDEDVTLKELLGGCICCSIQDKFEAQLQELLIDEKPEVIYIETTGAAHPVEVLDAVLSPLFADQLDIKGVITTVDGLRWLDRRALSPHLQQLLIEQVRHADFIIINKENELTEGEKAKITFEIQAYNEKAPCLLTTFSKVSMIQLKNLSLSPAFTYSDGCSRKKHLHLSTYVHTFTSSINSFDFENFLKNMPDTIYRIKGYIKFTQSELPYLFQFSYGTPIYLKESMNLPLNLVFIGEKVDWNSIARQLESLEK